MRLIIECW